jgi:hypothetical protein
MAQSAATVTNPNPTPPTNLSSTGSTLPNPLNYSANCYDAPHGINSGTPPYYDDTIPAYTATLGSLNESTGGAGGPNRLVFATNKAALNTGTGVGGTSVAAEGAGAETSYTQTYGANIYAPIPLITVGSGPALTPGVSPMPNQTHPSTLSPATNPTLTSLGTTSSVSGASGTYSQTVTGTGFTPQSIIYVNGVAQATTFTSSTSLTAPAVVKRTSAGTWPVTVVTGGVVTTAPQTWTFT